MPLRSSITPSRRYPNRRRISRDLLHRPRGSPGCRARRSRRTVFGSTPIRTQARRCEIGMIPHRPCTTAPRRCSRRRQGFPSRSFSTTLSSIASASSRFSFAVLVLQLPSAVCASDTIHARHTWPSACRTSPGSAHASGDRPPPSPSHRRGAATLLLDHPDDPRLGESGSSSCRLLLQGGADSTLHGEGTFRGAGHPASVAAGPRILNSYNQVQRADDASMLRLDREF